MNTILTLSISCVWGPPWRGCFIRLAEVPADMMLGDLHHYIQDLLGFDGIEWHVFYVANVCRGDKLWLTSDGTLVDSRELDDYPDNSELKLQAVYPLPPHKKLFYRYNFNRDWRFEIRKRGRASPAVPGVEYPRVIAQEGPQPDEFPFNPEDSA